MTPQPSIPEHVNAVQDIIILVMHNFPLRVKLSLFYLQQMCNKVKYDINLSLYLAFHLPINYQAASKMQRVPACQQIT